MKARIADSNKHIATELLHISDCLGKYATDMIMSHTEEEPLDLFFVAAELQAASRLLERYSEILDL